MQTVTNISQYKQLDLVIDSIYENINHLTSIHKSLIEDASYVNGAHDYTIYIDDLYFQRNILSREVEHLLLLKQLSIRRFYANLFKLYQHVTQTYIEVIKDRYIGGFGSPEHMRVFYYEPRIRLYNEIDVISLYSYSDIETITASIHFYVDIIQEQLQQMDYDIRDLEVKMSKGYHVHSILSAYRNERVRHTNDSNTYFHIFNSIQMTNTSIVQRFIQRAMIIRDEIHDNLSIDGQSRRSDLSSNKHTTVSNTVISTDTQTTAPNVDTQGDSPIKLKIDIPNSNTPNIFAISSSISSIPSIKTNMSEDDVSLLSKEGNSSIEKAMTDLIQQNMSIAENANYDPPSESQSESPISQPTIIGDDSDSTPNHRIRMECGTSDDDSDNSMVI
jgi:hypothetical protein